MNWRQNAEIIESKDKKEANSVGSNHSVPTKKISMPSQRKIQFLIRSYDTKIQIES